MSEMVNRRQGGMGASVDPIGSMDDVLDGYYQPGPERKHKSPTRRLIQHKDSTWEHKNKIRESVYKGQIQKGEYSQTYCISPGKSYVIEPQGGELPYEMAEKSPTKFYSRVLNQDIKKCKVNMRGRLYFEWTQRPLLKIISHIKNKLIKKLTTHLGDQFEEDIEKALEQSEIEDNIKEMVENELIELVDEDNQ